MMYSSDIVCNAFLEGLVATTKEQSSIQRDKIAEKKPTTLEKMISFL